MKAVPATLFAALRLAEHDCVAIVGGGGKTTIMYRLAAEAVAAGYTVVVGGTTRFTPPHTAIMPPPITVAECDNPVPAVREALRTMPALTVTSGRGDKGRWLPVSTWQVGEIAAMPEVWLIVLEADGSRNRPFKAPGENEPAIPAVATVVLAVVGLDAVGQPLTDEWVHRPEMVARLSGLRAGPGSLVTAACIAKVLLHPEGGRKAVPDGCRWVPVLNKAEPERKAVGDEVTRLLLAGGAETVLLATAGGEWPVVEVVERLPRRR